MTKSPTAENVERLSRAEAEAAEAAAEAAARAQAAAARAQAARERAEAARKEAYEQYLRVLSEAWPKKREEAATGLGDARAQLEQAVRDGGDIFGSYRAWVEASIAAWEVDAELAEMRHLHGQTSRATDPPVFDFGRDIAEIMNQVSLDLQDAAVERIRARRQAFVEGVTA